MNINEILDEELGSAASNDDDFSIGQKFGRGATGG